jgi:hypothetical protein
VTPSNFDEASMRGHDGEIWERLGFSNGFNNQLLFALGRRPGSSKITNCGFKTSLRVIPNKYLHSRVTAPSKDLMKTQSRDVRSSD